MKLFKTDFPFEEIRQGGEYEGNYFDSFADALLEANGNAFHVWSVVTGETDGGDIVLTYGPGQHYINVLGWICTQETHDGDTYYEEVLELDD